MTEKHRLQQYPAIILKQRALEVVTFDEDLKQKVSAMSEIMYDYNGIGLAGNQAGILQRIVVVDLSKNQNELQNIISFYRSLV